MSINTDSEEFKSLAEDVRQIKLALLGDEHLGIEGIVNRVQKLEASNKKNLLKLATLSAFLIGVGETLRFIFNKG